MTTVTLPVLAVRALTHAGNSGATVGGAVEIPARWAASAADKGAALAALIAAGFAIRDGVWVDWTEAGIARGRLQAS